MNKKGMGGHQSTKMFNDEWITPKEIIDRLGKFDLDPCAPTLPPYKIADISLDKYDNGLKRMWGDPKLTRVWLNPPYGSQTDKWLKKLIEHGNGIALIFSRTETKMFFDCVWNKAYAVLFIKGRLTFLTVDGKKAQNNAGAPSCLVAYGFDNAWILKNCGIEGKFVLLKDMSFI